MIRTLDLRQIGDRQQLHGWFAEALAFPADYGRNLDALHDLLTARSQPLCLTVLCTEDFCARLGDYAHAVLTVLHDSDEENPALQVVLHPQDANDKKETRSMNQPMLAPSMMCVNIWDHPEKTLECFARCGIELLHMDVMDGEFVPNLMMSTESIKQLRKASPIPLDIHLMIQRPEDKLAWFDIQPGEWVAVHVESTNHLQRALARIRDYGAHPMAALNPATPLSAIEEVLDDLDGVLLMTVNPGFAGQKLVPQTLGKIRRLREMLDAAGRPEVVIEVDGNVSFVNGTKMRAAGADLFVCGSSSVFAKDGTLEENIARFRQCVADGEKEALL